MNWPSARSRRASPPFRTTKREPESFAAVSKSIRPRASPISKCCLAPAGCADCRSGGARRCRSRRRRPAPPPSGVFGMAASASCERLARRRAPPARASAPLSFSRRDLGHQLLRPRLVLLGLGLADLLGEGVAALQGGLQGGDRRLAPVVEGDQVRGQRLHAPVPQALVEGRGVLADEADVVHGTGPCFAARPCPVGKAAPPTDAEDGGRP